MAAAAWAAAAMEINGNEDGVLGEIEAIERVVAVANTAITSAAVVAVRVTL